MLCLVDKSRRDRVSGPTTTAEKKNCEQRGAQVSSHRSFLTDSSANVGKPFGHEFTRISADNRTHGLSVIIRVGLWGSYESGKTIVRRDCHSSGVLAGWAVFVDTRDGHASLTRSHIDGPRRTAAERFGAGWALNVPIDRRDRRIDWLGIVEKEQLGSANRDCCSTGRLGYDPAFALSGCDEFSNHEFSDTGSRCAWEDVDRLVFVSSAGDGVVRGQKR